MALNGSPSTLDLFVDVVAANSAAYPGVKDSKVPLLEQRSRAYPGQAMLMRGGSVESRIKGGTRVESMIVLDRAGDYGLMPATGDWTWSGSSGHSYLTSHWRKHLATESIDEDELQLSMGGGVFDPTAVAMSLLNIDKLKKAKLWTTTAEVTEAEIWANANGAAGFTMEAAGATNKPRSLLSAVHETQTEHHNQTNPGYGAMPIGWTTQHGLNPLNFMSTDGTRSLLANQKFGYDVSMSSAVTAAGHIFDVMDDALDATAFESVPMAESFNEESNLFGAPGIFCSKRAKTQWNRTVRAHGEFFGVQGPTDPVQRSVFDGLKLIRVPALEGAAIYPLYTANAPVDSTASTGVVDTSASTNRGGRFWIFNPKYIKHYLRQYKAYQFRDWYALDQTNPEKYVCWLRLDDLIHFESFQRQAIVYPSTDQGTAY